jgi:hypothetical protein
MLLRQSQQTINVTKGQKILYAYKHEATLMPLNAYQYSTHGIYGCESAITLLRNNTMITSLKNGSYPINDVLWDPIIIGHICWLQ